MTRYSGLSERKTRFLAVLAAVAALWLAGPASADQVVVVTSFPKELTSAYKKAFEAKYPNVKLEILNKGTTAGIVYVREAPAASKPDVFWASAPDAFEVLAREKLLRKFEGGSPEIPARIGNYPMNDPEGFYRGQAISGYGIMWNTRYLKAHKLPEPREWADLAKPVYHGHVAISSPSKSGTTHLTVETILQGEGWDKGWRQMLEIAGNCAAVTERSFGVPDGVSSGQFGIGLVIDFLGLAAKNSGFPVDFVYPSVTALVPANIALIAGARNAEAAKTFIGFTLSPEGQQILLDPKISRLPVLPSVYAKAPAGYPNPFTGTIKASVSFDANLSESRYYVVTSMFDHAITFRLKELNKAKKAIDDAAARLAGKRNAEAEKLLAQARDLAFTPPVSAAKVKDKAFIAVFQGGKKDPEAARKIAAVEEQWDRHAKENYSKAAELAEKAAAMAR
ncbi:MAG: extracellular solute-binding protein [Nitrospirae bacterium]|nr:extracellular solute-binding protein [Nitrospirota bacterium]